MTTKIQRLERRWLTAKEHGDYNAENHAYEAYSQACTEASICGTRGCYTATRAAQTFCEQCNTELGDGPFWISIPT